jgi:hypothetical protein
MDRRSADGGERMRAMHAGGIGGQVHDGFLGDVGTGEFTGDDALAHDQHAVADADDLRQFAGDDDDGHALLGQLVDKLIDLALGIDIHTPRGLVQDQDLGCDLQPACQQNLLLVAAGELATACGWATLTLRRWMAPRATSSRAALRTSPMRLWRPATFMVALAPGHLQEQALALAVFRHVGDTGAHGRARLIDLHSLAFQQHMTAAARVRPEEQARQFGTPGARPARAPRPHAPRSGRLDLAAGQVLHLQYHRQGCRAFGRHAGVLVELAQ